MARAFDIRVPAAPDQVLEVLGREARLLDDQVLDAPRFHAWLPVRVGPRTLEAVARGTVDVGRDGTTHVRGHLSLPDPDQTLGTLLLPAAISAFALGWTLGSMALGVLGVLFAVSALASLSLQPSEEQALQELNSILGAAGSQTDGLSPCRA